MEGLPRAPHNGDRKAAARDSRETTYRQDEPVASTEYAPRQPRSNGGPSHYKAERSPKKGIIWTIAIAAVVIVLGFVAWFVFTGAKGQSTGIDSSRFQAVFLTNGQIYFGKLESFNDSTFKMTKIYYPQTTASEEETAAAAQSKNSNIQLIRLGDEVHGPDNEMFLTKAQILYYENLKTDGKVSELIKDNEKSR